MICVGEYGHCGDGEGWVHLCPASVGGSRAYEGFPRHRRRCKEEASRRGSGICVGSE